jgi:hypothetical protein
MKKFFLWVYEEMRAVLDEFRLVRTRTEIGALKKELQGARGTYRNDVQLTLEGQEEAEKRIQKRIDIRERGMAR